MASTSVTTATDSSPYSPNKASDPEKHIVAADLERATTSEQPHHGSTVVLFPAVDTAGYHRTLGRRQIMMITFGAGIGTGLWVGTGTALK